MVQFLRCVEPWHTFTAQLPAEQILMVVDYYCDVVLCKPVDQAVNLSQVVHVEEARLPFNGFPHDTESNDFDAPFNHLLHVLVSHRGLVIKAIVRGNVRW